MRQEHGKSTSITSTNTIHQDHHDREDDDVGELNLLQSQCLVTGAHLETAAHPSKNLPTSHTMMMMMMMIVVIVTTMIMSVMTVMFSYADDDDE